MEEKKDFNPWWLTLALLGIALVFLLAKGCGKVNKNAETTTANVQEASMKKGVSGPL